MRLRVLLVSTALAEETFVSIYIYYGCRPSTTACRSHVRKIAFFLENVALACILAGGQIWLFVVVTPGAARNLQFRSIHPSNVDFGYAVCSRKWGIAKKCIHYDTFACLVSSHWKKTEGFDASTFKTPSVYYLCLRHCTCKINMVLCHV